MQSKKGLPLSVAMENARGKLTQAVNQIIGESNLPAYLMEGILCEIISEIRNQKTLELLSDINSMKTETDEEA